MLILFCFIPFSSFCSSFHFFICISFFICFCICFGSSFVVVAGTRSLPRMRGRASYSPLLLLLLLLLATQVNFAVEMHGTTAEGRPLVLDRRPGQKRVRVGRLAGRRDLQVGPRGGRHVAVTLPVPFPRPVLGSAPGPRAWAIGEGGLRWW